MQDLAKVYRRGVIRCGCYDMVLVDLEGWKLWVPDAYMKATEEFMDSITGGCGPGSWGDYFVPDRLLGESIWLSCRNHDFMYWFGRDLQDKWWADYFFLGNMVTQVNDGEHLDNPRVEMAMKYYRAVSFMGEDSFLKEPNYDPEKSYTGFNVFGSTVLDPA